ncbi:TrmO family methyltransferase [Micromonospora sp. U56]|uniref:TrmO family methyltransferase domain-containing protein n=1 Tax=Micromonospora sp. U56 TaxID=2824900 RepID=UPI0035A88EB6
MDLVTRLLATPRGRHVDRVWRASPTWRSSSSSTSSRSTAPRPYRGRSDLPPVGVFAGRGPRRPNRIGVTCCAIESVQGRELTVVGLDAVSGTPVIDLKPTMAEFLPVDIKQPEWVSRVMSEYFQP